MVAEYCVGVDLGGTNLKAGLLDRDANVLCHFSVPAGIEEGREHVISQMVGAVARAIDQAGVPRASVIGIGIGSPGPLSHKRGLIINPGNLPCMKDTPIREILRERTGIRTTLDNDANAAAWGEFWAGAGKDIRDMVMFTLGTGVGGGAIVDGKLLRGAFEGGAELGHIIVQPGGRRCSCGQLGCLEAYASAYYLAERTTEEIRAGHASSLKAMVDRGKTIRSEHVERAAQEGDALAKRMWDDACRYLAQACVIMQHTTNPQRVVFAGGMINAGDFLLEPIRRSAKEMAWHLVDDGPEIMFATLGDTAGFIGAAGCAWEAHETGDW
jgi:glucokinase